MYKHSHIEYNAENTEDEHDQEKLLTLTSTKNTHTKKHAHTHTLPTDKSQLWAQSSAPAGTASGLLLTDRT